MKLTQDQKQEIEFWKDVLKDNPTIYYHVAHCHATQNGNFVRDIFAFILQDGQPRRVCPLFLKLGNAKFRNNSGQFRICEYFADETVKYVSELLFGDRNYLKAIEI